MIPKDATLVIRGRDDDPYRQDVPGSKVINCTNCGHKMMISPATQERALTVRNPYLLCVQCARQNYDETGRKLVILPPNEAQTAERSGG